MERIDEMKGRRVVAEESSKRRKGVLNLPMPSSMKGIGFISIDILVEILESYPFRLMHNCSIIVCSLALVHRFAAQVELE
jgi:hypothetical protein